MSDYRGSFAREMRNRGYAPNTLRAYGASLDRFLSFSVATSFPPGERISRFLDTYESQEPRRIAWSAIRLFYDLVLKKPCPYTMEKVRPRHRLPSFLERPDVLLLLSKIRNPRHRLDDLHAVRIGHPRGRAGTPADQGHRFPFAEHPDRQCEAEQGPYHCLLRIAGCRT